MNDPIDWSVPRQVVQWAVEECAHQHSGEISVAWMIDGWAYARGHQRSPITDYRLITLAHIVEPRANDVRDWRHLNVTAGGTSKPSWHDVPRQMDVLIEQIPAYLAAGDVDGWYRDFENVHPFADGNGRVGNIAWNWLRGTLEHPTRPPDFWSDTKHKVDADLARLVP